MKLHAQGRRNRGGGGGGGGLGQGGLEPPCYLVAILHNNIIMAPYCATVRARVYTYIRTYIYTYIAQSGVLPHVP